MTPEPSADSTVRALRVSVEQKNGGYDTFHGGFLLHHEYHVIVRLADGSFLVRPSHRLVSAFV